MRFIGNKNRLLDSIYLILKKENITGNSFFDFFSGTSNVAKYFKKLDYKVSSSDIMYFSYILQKAYIENNETPLFDMVIQKIETNNSLLSPLDQVIEYLNCLSGVKGFIAENYTPNGTQNLSIPRMYFSNDNGEKIDAIRIKIQKWYDSKLISKDEYFVLLACLIESVPFYANISGVYAAFQKKWDPRALKPFKLRNIEIIKNSHDNKSYNIDSLELLDNIEVDILYLDPPYNQRQYAPNYHVLETIAKYDDPIIKGITGMRNYDEQKSSFCNEFKALESLDKIAKTARYKTLILSYNSEGIMKEEDIKKVLNPYGELKLIEFDYLRFKSNNKGQSKTKKFIKEQLYILKK